MVLFDCGLLRPQAIQSRSSVRSERKQGHFRETKRIPERKRIFRETF